LRAATEFGIETVFVSADNDDVHALDFYRAKNGSSSAVTMFDFETRRAGRVRA
jgi:aminoglycoside 3-N-acetyltransferase I